MDNDKMHFATTKPADKLYQVFLDRELILESDRAIMLNEHHKGKDFAAVIYFPEAEIAELDTSPSDLKTHCPIKGDASYLNFRDIENGLWYYAEPISSVRQIKQHYAFDQSKGFRVVSA